MTPPATHPHTAAVLEALRDAGLEVGDAKHPDGAGWQGVPGQSQFVPYAVVWPIPGLQLSGSMGDPWDDGSVPFQVSGWGPNREGAERVTDIARAVLLGGGITVDGRHVLQIRPDGSLGVTEDDSLKPVLWHSRDRYRLDTVPDLTGS